MFMIKPGSEKLAVTNLGLKFARVLWWDGIRKKYVVEFRHSAHGQTQVLTDYVRYWLLFPRQLGLIIFPLKKIALKTKLFFKLAIIHKIKSKIKSITKK